MEKQIIKNLYSKKDLSEENLKEFQQHKLSAQQKADDLHKEFVSTQQELFDVGLFENEHFTIKGTQKIFDKEVELDMFQDDDNGLYTRYKFKTKFPSFDSHIKFIQLQIVDSKYDENRVPLKPYINKDKLYTNIYNQGNYKNGEYVYETKIECYRYSDTRKLKLSTFADKYFADANQIEERLNNSIFEWKLRLAKYSKAYKYVKTERYAQFYQSINKIVKSNKWYLKVQFQENHNNYISFTILKEKYGNLVLEFDISTDYSYYSRLLSYRARHKYLNDLFQLISEYTQGEVEVTEKEVLD
tara:strand:- start:16 stop:915 length:900 start_codon:yes stop_codon:yes gene_type:complete